jgi:H+/Cl- antiporter ClcA
MKTLTLIFFCILLNVVSASAQCAMCRSTLENNFSSGNPGIGAGINTGILYLLVLPYLAVLTLGYFWFKSTRNAKQELNSRNYSR